MKDLANRLIILKGTWKYLFGKGANSLWIMAIPAIFIPFIYSPSASIYFIFKHDLQEVETFKSIYLAMKIIPFKDLFWIGLIGLVLLICAIAILMDLIDRHMRVGKFTLNAQAINSQLNFNFLLAFEFTLIGVVILELGNIIEVSFFYLWTKVLHTPEAWTSVCFVTYGITSLVQIFLFSLVCLWPAYKLHMGYSSKEAFKESIKMTLASFGEIVLTLISMMLPINIITGIIGALNLHIAVRIVADIVEMTLIVPFYIVLMYTLFYEVTGLERMDLKKVDIWSKKKV